MYTLKIKFWTKRDENHQILKIRDHEIRFERIIDATDSADAFFEHPQHIESKIVTDSHVHKSALDARFVNSFIASMTEFDN